MAKIVCAWCGRILKEGPDEKISHAICLECFEREVKSIKERQPAKLGKPFAPPPLEEFRGSFSCIASQLLLGFALVALFFLIVMMAEGLHHLTGGRVPELIKWQPPPTHHGGSRDRR
ncbi:MAG: hypothetical protein WCO68_10645 [Verrucomicrobiota bacterium]